MPTCSHGRALLAVDEQTPQVQEDLIKCARPENQVLHPRHPLDRGSGYLSDSIVSSPRARPASLRRSTQHRAHRRPRRHPPDPEYLDLVDEIWQGLRNYVEEKGRDVGEMI
jgi:NitT/TauT family transport system ATP-binding protein